MPGREALEQEVGMSRELAQEKLSGRRVEVERDPALVRVERHPVHALPDSISDEIRRPVAGRIAGRRLDLDDIGAEIRQYFAGQEPKRSGQIEHAVRGQQHYIPVRARTSTQPFMRALAFAISSAEKNLCG